MINTNTDFFEMLNIKIKMDIYVSNVLGFNFDEFFQLTEKTHLLKHLFEVQMVTQTKRFNVYKI